jgi:hypothetical protein
MGQAPQQEKELTTKGEELSQDQTRNVSGNGKQEAEKKKTFWSGFPDAITVVACTATAYLCAFAFEAGSAEYFGIPLSLVRVDTDVLLLTGFCALMFGLWAYGQPLEIIHRFIENDKSKMPKPVRWWLAVEWIPSLLVSTLMIVAASQRSSLLVFSLLILLALVNVLGKPLLGFLIWRESRLRRPFLTVLADTVQNWEESQIEKRMSKESLTKYVLMVGFFCLLSYWAGLVSNMVRSSERLCRIDSKGTSIVLKVYGNTAILAPIDTNYVVYPEFELVKLDEIKAKLVLRKVKTATPLPVKAIPFLFATNATVSLTNQTSFAVTNTRMVSGTNVPSANTIPVPTNAPVVPSNSPVAVTNSGASMNTP